MNMFENGSFLRRRKRFKITRPEKDALEAGLQQINGGPLNCIENNHCPGETMLSSPIGRIQPLQTQTKIPFNVETLAASDAKTPPITQPNISPRHLHLGLSSNIFSPLSLPTRPFLYSPVDTFPPHASSIYSSLYPPPPTLYNAPPHPQPPPPYLSSTPPASLHQLYAAAAMAALSSPPIPLRPTALHMPPPPPPPITLASLSALGSSFSRVPFRPQAILSSRQQQQQQQPLHPHSLHPCYPGMSPNSAAAQFLSAHSPPHSPPAAAAATLASLASFMSSATNHNNNNHHHNHHHHHRFDDADEDTTADTSADDGRLQQDEDDEENEHVHIEEDSNSDDHDDGSQGIVSDMVSKLRASMESVVNPHSKHDAIVTSSNGYSTTTPKTGGVLVSTSPNARSI